MTQTIISGLAKFLVQIGTTEDEALQIIAEYRKRMNFRQEFGHDPTGSSDVTKEHCTPYKSGSGDFSREELERLLPETERRNRAEYFAKFGHYPEEHPFARKKGATVGGVQLPSQQEALVDRPLIQRVMQELHRAREKHLPMNSLHEGYAIILEELDELWDEIKQQEPDMARVEKEAVQVAAMAFRLVLDVVRR